MGRSQVLYNRITAKIRAERGGRGCSDRNRGDGRRRRDGSRAGLDERQRLSNDDENDNNNNDDEESSLRSSRKSSSLPPFSPSSRSLQQRHGNNQSIVKHGRARDSSKTRLSNYTNDDADDVHLNSTRLTRHRRELSPSIEDEADALLSLDTRYQFGSTDNSHGADGPYSASCLHGSRNYYSTSMTPSDHSTSRHRKRYNNASSLQRHHGPVDTGMPTSSAQVEGLCKRMGETLQCVPAADQWRVSSHLVETMYSASERRRQQMKLDEWKNSRQQQLDRKRHQGHTVDTDRSIPQPENVIRSFTDIDSKDGSVSNNARSYTSASVSSISRTQSDDDYGSKLLEQQQFSTASSDFESTSVFLEPTSASLVSINRKQYDSDVSISVPGGDTKLQKSSTSTPATLHDLNNDSRMRQVSQASSFSQSNDEVPSTSLSQVVTHHYQEPTVAWINYQQQQSSHHLNTPKASPLTRKNVVPPRPPSSPFVSCTSPNSSSLMSQQRHASSFFGSTSDASSQRSNDLRSANTLDQSGTRIPRSPSSGSSKTNRAVIVADDSGDSMGNNRHDRYHQIPLNDTFSTRSAYPARDNNSGSVETETVHNISRHFPPHADTSTGYSLIDNVAYSGNRDESHSDSHGLSYSRSSTTCSSTNGSSRILPPSESLTATVATTIQPTTVGGRISSQNATHHSRYHERADIINVEDLVMHDESSHIQHYDHSRNRHNNVQVPIIVLDDMSSSIHPQSTEDTMDKWLDSALQSQLSNADDDAHGNTVKNVIQSEVDNELDSWLDSVIS